ncbi:MAG: hypothetical protein WCF84_18330 [Anaerolineae bacterium]
MDHSDERDALSLRGGLTIYPSQSHELNAVLSDLLQQLPARLSVLAEVSGQVIMVHRAGSNTPLDTTALGALMASDLAASQEIARLTGEYQAYQLVMRQGNKSHIFISEAGRSLALLVQVSSEVPMGWARMLIIQAAHKLEEILAHPPENTFNLAQEMGLNDTGDSSSGGLGLGDLLNNELDSMWSDDGTLS